MKRFVLFLAIAMVLGVSATAFAFNDKDQNDYCVYMLDGKHGTERGVQLCGTNWPHETANYNHQASMRTIIATNTVSLLGYRFTYEASSMKPLVGIYTEYWEAGWSKRSKNDVGRTEPVTTVYCYASNYGATTNWMKAVNTSVPSSTYADEINNLVQTCLNGMSASR